MPKVSKSQLTFLDNVVNEKRHYGVPYQGSKNQIAKRIIDELPSARYFVDLFGGGGAMTDAAIASGKYDRYIMNDLDGQGQEVYRRALSGDVDDFDSFVSRVQFKKSEDPVERTIYSFGNNRKDYLYSKEKEEGNRYLHNAIGLNNPNDREYGWFEMARRYPRIAELYGFSAPEFVYEPNLDERRIAWSGMSRNSGIEVPSRSIDLERISRIRSLRNPDAYGKVTFLNDDYRDIDIPEDAVVYADPPYRNTRFYRGSRGFDFGAFDGWALNNPNRVYISEYSMPDEFRKIGSFRKTRNSGGGNQEYVGGRIVDENLYTNGK